MTEAKTLLLEVLATYNAQFGMRVIPVRTIVSDILEAMEPHEFYRLLDMFPLPGFEDCVYRGPITPVLRSELTDIIDRWLTGRAGHLMPRRYSRTCQRLRAILS